MIVDSCPTGETLHGIDKCQFLLENTNYINSTNPVVDILTETICDDSAVWTINAKNLQLQSTVAGGLKPVIEVPKTRMSY